MSKKSPLGTEAPSFQDGPILGDLILNGNGPEYAVWDTQAKNGNGQLYQAATWNTSKCLLRAPDDKNQLLTHGIVLLSSGPIKFGTDSSLHDAQLGFIKQYLEVPDLWANLIATYARMTWVYDKFSAVPYLRFLGESETGKTRALQVVAAMSYRATIAGGSTTSAPIFRLLDRFRGTFVWDEADPRTGSDLTSDIIKILNAGYIKDFPVLRCSGEDYEPQAFSVYGPKILSTRKRFEDDALESRCITLETIKRVIPSNMGLQVQSNFAEQGLVLRNMLLSWRFCNWHTLPILAAPGLSDRIGQLAIPLYSVALPEFRNELVSFLSGERSQQKRDLPQTIVVEAIRRELAYATSWPQEVSIKNIALGANQVRSDWDCSIPEFDSRRIAALVRHMGIVPLRKEAGYQIYITKSQLDKLSSDWPVS